MSRDRVDHVQRVDDVVRLGEDGVLAVLHRVGRAGHLAVVHDRLGLELAEQSLGDVPLGEVALGEPDLLTGDVLPGGDAVGQPGGDRREGVGAGFLVRAATQVVVDDVDLVAAVARTASRSAIRGSRRRPGSGCAWVVLSLCSGGKTPHPTGWSHARSARAPRTRSTSSERVVVAEADPDGAAGFQDAQPLEQFHRVVVPVPGEDPALRERLRRVPGMLIAQPYRERRRSARPAGRCRGRRTAVPAGSTPGPPGTGWPASARAHRSRRTPR